MRQAFWTRDPAAALGARSALPTYRFGALNHCPACARSHWLIGRLTAECAFCGAALPIAVGAPPVFRYLAKAA